MICKSISLSNRSGNSKYHYYGIQVKSSSPLIKQMPLENDFLLLSNANNDFDYPNIDTQSNHFNMSPDEYIFSPLSANQNASMDFFFANDTASASNELPSEIDLDDIRMFHKTHEDYSNKLFQAFIKFQYDFIEKSMQQFWSLTNVHLSQINEVFTNGIDFRGPSERVGDIRVLCEHPFNAIQAVRETSTGRCPHCQAGVYGQECFCLKDSITTWKFQRMCTLPCILDQLRSFYLKFYQTIIDSYFPDVLSSLTQTIAVRYLCLRDAQLWFFV